MSVEYLGLGDTRLIRGVLGGDGGCSRDLPSDRERSLYRRRPGENSRHRQETGGGPRTRAGRPRLAAAEPITDRSTRSIR